MGAEVRLDLDDPCTPLLEQAQLLYTTKPRLETDRVGLFFPEVAPAVEPSGSGLNLSCSSLTILLMFFLTQTQELSESLVCVEEEKIHTNVL